MPLNELHTVPQVSVIMPSFNEEKTIGNCIRKINEIFEKNGITGEIIVSDSSTDRTAEIAESLGAIVIHPVNRGYGYAYLEAFHHVKAEYIVMMDSDGTYDPIAIPDMIELLKAGTDLVIGSRFKGRIEDGAMTPLHRYIGNPLLTGVLNIVFHTRFSDAHSGFRAIHRDALEKLQLKTDGMEFASEMLIMASIKDLKIAEVPISYFPRVTPSNLHTFADGWRHLRFILLMKPVPFLAVPGLIFFISGFALMSLFYLEGNVEVSHLHSFILGAILLISGIQIIITGVNTEVYSTIYRYREETELLEFFLNYHSLEKFLIIGGVLILGGILIGLSIFLSWINAKFGELSQISTSVVALSLIVIGIQIISCSIFISMMLLDDGGSR